MGWGLRLGRDEGPPATCRRGHSGLHRFARAPGSGEALVKRECQRRPLRHQVRRRSVRRGDRRLGRSREPLLQPPGSGGACGRGVSAAAEFRRRGTEGPEDGAGEIRASESRGVALNEMLADRLIMRVGLSVAASRWQGSVEVIPGAPKGQFFTPPLSSFSVIHVSVGSRMRQ